MEQLFKALDKRAVNFPGQTALVSSETDAQTIITNQQLVDQITHIASFFETEGVQ